MVIRSQNRVFKLVYNMGMNEPSASNPNDSPKIDGIRILDVLGRGAFSTVYKGVQLQLDRTVAIKVLVNSSQQSERDLARFKREAKVTSELDHPNIVQVLGYGSAADGSPYLVLEYVEGQTLACELLKNEPFTYEQFGETFIPVLSALSYAHFRGVIHRDIKPENIMLGKSAVSSDAVKLLDFGVAKLLEPDFEPGARAATMTGRMIGSPKYMSPEQCAGKAVDSRSDLYSIACVMYQCLCGTPPFEAGTTLETMQLHLNSNPISEPELVKRYGIEPRLAKLVLKNLSKNPAERAASAEELKDDLSEILRGKSGLIKDEISSGSQKPIKSFLQDRVILTCISAAIVAIVGGGILWKARNDALTKAVNIAPNPSALVALARRYQGDPRDWERASDVWKHAYDLKAKANDFDYKWMCANQYAHSLIMVAKIKGRNEKIDLKLRDAYSMLVKTMKESANKDKDVSQTAFVEAISVIDILNDKKLAKEFALFACDYGLKVTLDDRLSDLCHLESSLLKLGLPDLSMEVGDKVIAFDVEKTRDGYSTIYILCAKATKAFMLYTYKHDAKSADALAKECAKELHQDQFAGSSYRLTVLNMLIRTLMETDPSAAVSVITYELREHNTMYCSSPFVMFRVFDLLAQCHERLRKPIDALNDYEQSLSFLSKVQLNGKEEEPSFQKVLENAIALASKMHDKRLEKFKAARKCFPLAVKTV